MSRLGRDFRLQLNHPTEGWIGAWCPRSDSITINNEQIDVTCKEDIWRVLLSGGIRSAEISSSGLFASGNQADWVNDKAFSGSIVNFRFISGPSQEIYLTGSAQITGYERSGESKDAEFFSLSLTTTGALDGGGPGDNILDHLGIEILDHLGQPIEAA